MASCTGLKSQDTCRASISSSLSPSGKQSVMKASVESVYPSPAEEVRHDLAPPSPSSPHRRHMASQQVALLPPIKEHLGDLLGHHPLSPSTSPHMIYQPYELPRHDSTIQSAQSGIARNDTFDKDYLHRPADPQLFPEITHEATPATDRQQPLFPTSTPSKPTEPGVQAPARFTSRQRKRTPQRAPPPTFPANHPNRRISMFDLVMRDPLEFFLDRREEEKDVSPSKAAKVDSSPMSRTPSSQTLSGVSGVAAKRKRDTDAQTTAPKRQKVTKSEAQSSQKQRLGTRSSPREVLMHTFDGEAAGQSEQTPKQLVKRAITPVHAVKKAKQIPEVPDAYKYYDDTTPEMSTLDNAGLTFPASWGGRPLNLEDDPDRKLLHDKEIKLASKLALTCARYLYLKRRLFAGRLDYARKNQKYNINAAQQQCKGQDAFGVPGADVNKTSALWKAFNNVGWLDAVHMERYM